MDHDSSSPASSQHQTSYLFSKDNNHHGQNHADTNSFTDNSAPSIMRNHAKGYDNFIQGDSTGSPETFGFSFPQMPNGSVLMPMEYIERPQSAPLMNSYPNSAFTSFQNSPMFSPPNMMPSTMTNSPSNGGNLDSAPRPLTNAQRVALASVEASRSNPITSSLLAHGIDTSELSPDQIKSLASQMQSISSTTAAELRRQLHIHSEQKRRAQIKNGFDDLRMEIPGCAEQKKMSKAMVLVRAIEYMQRLKQEREFLFSEIERLRVENERFRSA